MLEISGSNFSYQHVAFERFAQDMDERGLRTVEIWGIAPHLDLLSPRWREISAMQQTLDRHGLRVDTVTPEQVVYPINIATPDEDLRQRSIEYFEHALQVAADLGARKLLLTPGRGAEDEPAAAGWARSQAGVDRIVTFAKTLGVRVVFEPLPRNTTNLVNTIEDVVRFVAGLSVDSRDNMGLVLDTVGMSMAGDTVDSYFAAEQSAGLAVEHVHIVDGRPWGHLVWGEGSLDLEGVLREVNRAGYEGFGTFEFIGAREYALEPSRYLDENLDRFANIDWMHTPIDVEVASIDSRGRA